MDFARKKVVAADGVLKTVEAIQTSWVAKRENVTQDMNRVGGKKDGVLTRTTGESLASCVSSRRRWYTSRCCMDREFSFPWTLATVSDHPAAGCAFCSRLAAHVCKPRGRWVSDEEDVALCFGPGWIMRRRYRRADVVYAEASEPSPRFARLAEGTAKGKESEIGEGHVERLLEASAFQTPVDVECLDASQSRGRLAQVLSDQVEGNIPVFPLFSGAVPESPLVELSTEYFGADARQNQ